MRQAAMKSTNKPMQIISKCLKRTSDSTKVNVPNPSNLTRMINRVRSSKDDNPKLPTTLNEITIPDSLKVDDNGDSFLHHDSGSGQNRFIVYATKLNFKLLKTCDTWIMDGTFDSTPPLFHQVSINCKIICLFLL